MKTTTITNNTFFDNLNNFTRTGSNKFHGTSFSNLSGKFKKNRSFFIPLAVVLVFVLAVVFFFFRNNDTKTSASNVSKSEADSLQNPVATKDINKNYTFKVENSEGKEVKLGYTIDNAELRDTIVIKGQVANSVPGRDFLVVNLKLKNDTDADVDVDARNYLRFILGTDNELFAPDIHNDPVTVQAISTKATRLGIPVDEGQKEFKIQVGEIAGKKETIDIKFD